MRQATARRISALVALLGAGAAVAVTILSLVEHLAPMVGATAAFATAIGACAFGLTRTGPRRLVGLVVAVLALVAGLVVLAIYGTVPLVIIEIVLLAITGVAGRFALGRDVKSLKAAPVPGATVGRATHPSWTKHDVDASSPSS
jgi:hypothetical protein